MAGPAPVVFIDTETTGLDPDRHELWEIALIDASGEETSFQPQIRRLDLADPGSLRLVRFYERTSDADWYWQDREHVARGIAEMTAGLHLVAAVPSFDATFLSAFLRAHGLREAWHYHLVDVEALAAGKLGMAPPWDSADLAKRLGIESDRPDFAKHTAMGDARWAKAIYDAVLA